MQIQSALQIILDLCIPEKEVHLYISKVIHDIQSRTK